MRATTQRVSISVACLFTIGSVAFGRDAPAEHAHKTTAPEQVQQLEAVSKRHGAEAEQNQFRMQLAAEGNSALPVLRAALTKDDLRTQYFAATVLSDIVTDEATDELLLLLRENRPRAVQLAAIRGLKGRALNKSDFLPLLRHEKPAVRLAAFENLEDVQLDKDLLAAVSSALEEEAWRSRCSIVRMLGRNRQTQADEKVPLVVESLKREMRSPSGSEKPASSYLSRSEYVKRQHTFSLQDMGSASLPSLRRHLPVAEGEMRQRLIIALGYLGDEAQKDELVDIVEDARIDGNIRALAVRSLGKLKPTSAVPVLEEALQDEFFIVYTTDVKIPGMADEKRIYPIRDEAAAALRDMGKTVKRNGYSFLVEDN